MPMQLDIIKLALLSNPVHDLRIFIDKDPHLADAAEMLYDISHCLRSYIALARGPKHEPDKSSS